MSAKMVKSVRFFFQSYHKCFISDSIFRFGQIVFTLARTFAVHREKSVVSVFLGSVLITYLPDNLESEKRNYCFGKNTGKSLEFWIEKSVRTLSYLCRGSQTP